MESTNDLKKMIEFLHNYKWIYDFKLTDFFMDRIWEEVPHEWIPSLLNLTYEELNQIPYGYKKCDWPESLREFFSTAESICIKREEKAQGSLKQLDQQLKKGMNPKKQHEASRMAALVHDLALKTGSDVIVDVGSGLGYLGQTLSELYGHPIIGVEGKQSHSSSADKRKVTNGKMVNVTLELENTEESRDNFRKVIFEAWNQLYSEIQCKTCTAPTESKTSCHEHACVGKGRIKKTSCHEHSCVDKERNDLSSQDDVIENFHDQGDSDKYMCNSIQNDTQTILKHEKDTNKDVLREEQVFSSDGCAKYSTLGDTDSNKDLSETELEATGSDSFEDSDKHCTFCSSYNFDIGYSTRQGNHAYGCGIERNCTCNDKNSCHGNHGSNSSHGNNPRTPCVLMIGLHCCGDLTPTMMNFYHDLNFISGLCCVSCCYHRMRYDETSNCFDNFPLSSTLKSVMSSTNNLSLYGMRLAAQETRSRWGNQSHEDHDYHVRNVAYRGILELFTKQESCDYNKLFRKLTRKSDMVSFESYIEAVLKRTQVHNDTGEENTQTKEKLFQLYDKYKEFICYIEPFTVLQVVLQPVIETLVYTDRQTWLQEQGYQTLIVPVFNDKISPRNLALISNK